MPREISVDETVGEFRYKISKVNARDGSWLAKIVLQKMILGSETRAEFDAVQQIALAACARYGEGPVPLPVVMADGRFAYEDLKYDTVSVTKLTAQALAFNLKDFLADGGKELDNLKKAFQDLNPPIQEN